MNFPVVVPKGRGSDISRAMILSGYDVGRSLYPNAHRHPKYTDIAGESANIDNLVANTIYLPTHFGVTPIYAEEIASRLVTVLGGLKDLRPQEEESSN